MTRLPDDICRCRDADCPEREGCLRWIQRDIGSSRLVSADSLFPFDTVSVVYDACPNRIPATQLATVRYGLYEGLA